MADTAKSIWSSLDTALTVTLKLIALGVIVLLVVGLAFCSDQTLKQGSTHTLARLALVGFTPTKVNVFGVELQMAATGTEAANAAGLSSELKALADNKQIPQDVRARLGGLARQVGDYAQKLTDRDKKVVQAMRTVSRAPAADARPVTGWIYMGRRSSAGDWAPLSDKITLSGSEGARGIQIEKDVALVDKDPGAPSQAEDATPSAADSREPIRLIRASNRKLQVLGVQESPSIGSAKLQWARVEVDPSELYEVRP